MPSTGKLGKKYSPYGNYYYGNFAPTWDGKKISRTTGR